jgi:hypothetical protein
VRATGGIFVAHQMLVIFSAVAAGGG